MQQEDFLNGQVLLIDKPLQWTSFDVVNKLRFALRKAFQIKKIKVGHAGTLDPLATGLLIICVGKKTKQINTYMGLPKTYTGTIALGATTPSYDRETEIDQHFPTNHLTEELLRKSTAQFEGDILQQPPNFSAIKKGGVKAYEAARKGEDLKLAPRPVHIEYFKLTDIRPNAVDFEVRCSKGTYIRSLAHDFGQALHSGAHLSALRRTAIGEYQVGDALSIEAFLNQLPPSDKASGLDL